MKIKNRYNEMNTKSNNNNNIHDNNNDTNYNCKK